MASTSQWTTAHLKQDSARQDRAHWFYLGRVKGLDIFETGYPKSEVVPCDSTATVDGKEETVLGKAGLSYNAGTQHYEYD
jgi:hypothetical protein